MPKTVSQLIREGYNEERRAIEELAKLIRAQTDVMQGLISAVRTLGVLLTETNTRLDQIERKR